jgi:hypothetical protein
MNEKIRQLAEQATRNVESANSYHSTVFDKEKFAELIILECAEQSMSIGCYNTPSNITPDLAIAIAVGLKKHFGVEE